MLYITAPRMRKVTHCAVLLAGPHHQASPLSNNQIVAACSVWKQLESFVHFHPTAPEDPNWANNERRINVGHTLSKRRIYISSRLCVCKLYTHASRRKSDRVCRLLSIDRLSLPIPLLSPPIPPYTHKTRRQGPFSFDTSVPHPLASSCVFFYYYFGHYIYREEEKVFSELEQTDTVRLCVCESVLCVKGEKNRAPFASTLSPEEKNTSEYYLRGIFFDKSTILYSVTNGKRPSWIITWFLYSFLVLQVDNHHKRGGAVEIFTVFGGNISI